ncbi:hypothetical protein ACLOJK_027941 [Asimina triloba]
MERNVAAAGVSDEESSHAGSRTQPFSSTPRHISFSYCSASSLAVSAEHVMVNLKTDAAATFGHLLSQRMGMHDFFSLDVWRASVGEMLGTAVLVFMIDTIVISSTQANTNTPNLLIAALAFVTVTILLVATIPVSGGHMSPTITLASTLLGLISPARAAVYVLAQCVGGVLGALALKAVLGSSRSIEQEFSLGGCTLTIIAPGPDGPTAIGIEAGSALWLEIICCFVLLHASVWTAFDARQAKAHGILVVCLIIGSVVGLLVFVSTTLTAKKGYSGAGMNPARCLGPALVRGGHLWDGHWVFWVGPIIACVAFYLYVKIIPRQIFQGEDDYKYDLLTTLKILFRWEQ